MFTHASAHMHITSSVLTKPEYEPLQFDQNPHLHQTITGKLTETAYAITTEYGTPQYPGYSSIVQRVTICRITSSAAKQAVGSKQGRLR